MQNGQFLAQSCRGWPRASHEDERPFHVHRQGDELEAAGVAGEAEPMLAAGVQAASSGASGIAAGAYAAAINAKERKRAA